MNLLTVALRSSSILAALLCFACTTADGGGSGGGTGGGTGSTVTESACDPLAPAPIALGMVVGVGKDGVGTLYVDAVSGVYIPGDGKLVRQHVTGTGQSGTSEYLFSFVAPGGAVSTASNLLVETQGATAIAMALGPGDSKSFLGQSDAGVTPLTVIDPATVSGMATVNTPNVISYVADVANGDVLLATTPMNDDATSDDGGLAIFYGPPGGMVQRTITAFEQSLSNDGSVTFDVDGAPYVLAFGDVQAPPDAGPFGVFTLEGLTPQGGAELAVTLRSPTPTAVPPGLSFTCLPEG